MTREIKFWRYSVKVESGVIGSFSRVVRAETAQHAAAIVVAGMGDQGPWGGRSLQLDAWLHKAEIRIRVDCLQLDEMTRELTIEVGPEWQTIKGPK